MVTPGSMLQGNPRKKHTIDVVSYGVMQCLQALLINNDKGDRSKRRCVHVQICFTLAARFHPRLLAQSQCAPAFPTCLSSSQHLYNFFYCLKRYNFPLPLPPPHFLCLPPVPAGAVHVPPTHWSSPSNPQQVFPPTLLVPSVGQAAAHLQAAA